MCTHPSPTEKKFKVTFPHDQIAPVQMALTQGAFYACDTTSLVNIAAKDTPPVPSSLLSAVFELFLPPKVVSGDFRNLLFDICSCQKRESVRVKQLPQD